MASTVLMAVSAAAALAMISAAFGVGVARMVWADDLKFTQHLESERAKTDKMRDEAESSLRETIVSLKSTIKIQRDHLKLLDRAP